MNLSQEAPNRLFAKYVCYLYIDERLNERAARHADAPLCCAFVLGGDGGAADPQYSTSLDMTCVRIWSYP